MEALAKARFQRFGTRKVASVLDRIRGMRVLEAEAILPSIPRRAGRMIEKTLKSAASNFMVKAARAGHKADPAALYVKSCWSGMGPMGALKRMRPGPQGRAMLFRRKLCHVAIVVSDESQNGARHGSKVPS